MSATPAGRLVTVVGTGPIGYVRQAEATALRPAARTTEQLLKTPRPGGTSLVSLRRVGSPNTHDRSGEIPMVLTKNPGPRTANPDCVALGCDWDWGVESCPGCGGSHTYRICLRCLTPDNSEFELCRAGGSAVAA